MNLDNNKGLLQRLIKGEHAVFEIIYRSYFIRLHYFAKEYVISTDAADDIIQNVFTKLWLYRKTLREDTLLDSWLFTVTKNECLSYLSHLKVIKQYQNEITSRLLDANYYALRQIDVSDNTFFNIVDIIKETMTNLPPQCRKAFECSRLKLMSNKEIAKEMEVSIKTVESYITLSLKLIRNALHDYLPLLLAFNVIFY